MNTRCRIGLHKWKPVQRRLETQRMVPVFLPFVGATFAQKRFKDVGEVCVRCGKRIKPGRKGWIERVAGILAVAGYLLVSVLVVGLVAVLLRNLWLEAPAMWVSLWRPGA